MNYRQEALCLFDLYFDKTNEALLENPCLLSDLCPSSLVSLTTLCCCTLCVIPLMININQIKAKTFVLFSKGFLFKIKK